MGLPWLLKPFIKLVKYLFPEGFCSRAIYIHLGGSYSMNHFFSSVPCRCDWNGSTELMTLILLAVPVRWHLFRWKMFAFNAEKDFHRSPSCRRFISSSSFATFYMTVRLCANIHKCPGFMHIHACVISVLPLFVNSFRILEKFKLKKKEISKNKWITTCTFSVT